MKSNADKTSSVPVPAPTPTDPADVTVPTLEDIQSEPAGSRLDSWVAERVMGGTWTVLVSPKTYGPDGFADGGVDITGIPKFSTDIAAAWEVVEKFTDVVIEKAGAGYECRISAVFEALAPTATLAICRAALLAVGGGA